MSIPLRYGTTTVFALFLVLILPHFPCFGNISIKKVGRPFDSKIPQTLDFTWFFIFETFTQILDRLFCEKTPILTLFCSFWLFKKPENLDFMRVWR